MSLRVYISGEQPFWQGCHKLSSTSSPSTTPKPFPCLIHHAALCSLPKLSVSCPVHHCAACSLPDPSKAAYACHRLNTPGLGDNSDFTGLSLDRRDSSTVSQFSMQQNTPCPAALCPPAGAFPLSIRHLLVPPIFPKHKPVAWVRRNIEHLLV